MAAEPHQDLPERRQLHPTRGTRAFVPERSHVNVDVAGCLERPGIWPEARDSLRVVVELTTVPCAKDVFLDTLAWSVTRKGGRNRSFM